MNKIFLLACTFFLTSLVLNAQNKKEMLDKIDSLTAVLNANMQENAKLKEQLEIQKTQSTNKIDLLTKQILKLDSVNNALLKQIQVLNSAAGINEETFWNNASPWIVQSSNHLDEDDDLTSIFFIPLYSIFSLIVRNHAIWLNSPSIERPTNLQFTSAN